MLADILKGGIINVLLLISYFAVCVIIIERVSYYISIAGSYKKFKVDLFSVINDKGSAITASAFENLPLVKYKKTPFYSFAKAYIENIDSSFVVKKEVLSQVGNDVISKMESSVWILGLLEHLSPLMGLLGTMTGLIKAFKVIESLGGSVDITVLAGGIWEAMMTTVMGLTVAILAFFSHKILDHHIEKKTIALDNLLSELNVVFKANVQIESQLCYQGSDKQGVDDDIS